MNVKNILFCVALGAVCWGANAELIDRPGGIKIGTRMTLRPYVSFSYTFDSNMDGARSSGNSSSWTINPGLTLDYRAENWTLAASVHYGWHVYSNARDDRIDHQNWGESVAWNWHGEDGWSAVISESYSKILADDDMMAGDGKGLWRDRLQLTVSGALNKQITEKVHAGINGNVYGLDYSNDSSHFAPLYGWSRWSVGGTLGYTFGAFSDLFVSGAYHGYTQDDDHDLYGESGYRRNRKIGQESSGYSVHIGMGSWMTEKITYSVSAGYSSFRYGGGSNNNGGFTYNGNLNWMISETWNMMAAIDGYYQPSEREYGSSQRTDSLMWGLSHSMIRGKLSATLNLTYRHETHECCDYVDSDYNMDILTARLGLDYTLNRFLSFFASVEYQTEINDGGRELGNNYDYDRFRGTLGFRLAY